MQMRTRISWIDIAKLAGILAIYAGHLTDFETLHTQYIFLFHVPIFFFIAGCMESLNNEKSFVLYARKKFVNFSVPFLTFAIINIIIWGLYQESSLRETGALLFQVSKGVIRSTFIGISLWFLSCLFVINILFFFIKKIKSKMIILLVCGFLYYIYYIVLSPMLLGKPSWIFNIDSALLYIIYYAIGYLSFDKIVRLFEEPVEPRRYIFLYLTGGSSLLYSALTYYRRDPLLWITKVPVVNIFYPVFSGLIVMWLIILLAYCCRSSTLLSEMGKNTLYFCGNEHLMRRVMDTIFSIVGVTRELNNVLATYLYAFFLLAAIHYVLVPIEKKIIETVKKNINVFLDSLPIFRLNS